jgi:hypothetical protein
MPEGIFEKKPVKTNYLRIHLYGKDISVMASDAFIVRNPDMLSDRRP